jgi:phosphoglucomutase
MMAALNQPVNEIVHKHWQRFGRCYFQRRDYFIPDSDNANALVGYLSANIDALAENPEYGPQIESADIFTYTDPVDGSISANQGVRIYCADGGRIVFRLSGTGTSGATLRVYLDRVEKDPAMLEMETSLAVGKLADMAANIARIEHFTGLTAPTTII